MEIRQPTQQIPETNKKQKVKTTRNNKQSPSSFSFSVSLLFTWIEYRLTGRDSAMGRNG